MLIAEAMSEKAMLAQEIAELTDRINVEAVAYPSDNQPNLPAMLIQLDEAWERYLELELSLWQTGMITIVANGENLTTAIARRDAMNQMASNYAKLATRPNLLYNQKDLLNRDGMRGYRDELVEKARLLDFKIQEKLWTVEI
jgi:hypothetical protein